MKKKEKVLKIKVGDGFALLFAMTDVLKELGIEKKRAMEVAYNFYRECIEIGRGLPKIKKK